MLEKVGDHRTCLEQKMYGYLVELGFTKGVDFYEQYPYGHYILDFCFIKSRNPFRALDIETDGYKWHSAPQKRKSDGYRTYKLMQAGFLVERFGEKFSIEDVRQVLVKHNLLPGSPG